MRSVLALLFLLLALGGPPAAVAQDRAYAEVIQRSLEAVRRAQGVSGAQRAQAIDAALAALREADVVPTPAGTVSPYLGHIEDALRANPPRVDTAEEMLEALATELSRAAPREANPDQEDALRDVLAQPQFQPDRPQAWWQRLSDAIQDLLERLFGGVSLGGPGQEAVSLAQVLLVVLSVALVGGVALLLLRNARGQLRRRDRDEGERGPSEEMTPGSMLARAAEYARRGDYRSAVRADFISLLLDLNQRGRLRYDRWLTNREHLTRIGYGTPLAESLAPIVRVFDDVWYGRAPLDADGYRAYKQRSDALRSEQSP